MERKIIEHCAPTLAGLKCGNMFKVTDRERADMEVARMNDHLGPRGVSVRIMFSCASRDLVLVYREGMLGERLSSPGVPELLKEIGYDCSSVPSCLTTLSERMSRGEMPPEVGIFLGYPLEDVRGFMENKGRRCKAIGCWKVYGDEESAAKTFSKYRKCRDVFLRKYDAGFPLTKLAVSA
ncbi:MAG: DUF3793 family protein [Candidatus Methanoplasma sp.]|jgi:hypothetical protein|nr:DUF3793 family protein [Candidatus Methanoplasma sp.]